MFFLGISAHLFIYLLVPAFLTICLLNNGTSDFSEVSTLFPKVISYEVSVRDCPEETYVYCATELAVEYEEKQSLFAIVSQRSFFFPRSFVYVSPSAGAVSLRAPPVNIPVG